MPAENIPPQFPNYFELFQNIVNPFAAGANAGANPAAMMMASFDPKEIARKQQELETVLMWLKAQVGVVELSLKTLEYQKSLLEQMASSNPPHSPGSPEAKDGAGPSVEELAKMAGAMNPAAWAWNMMQQPTAAPAAKKPAAGKAKKTKR